MYVYIICSSTCFSICWSPIAMHMRHVFVPGKGNNPLRSAKKYVLQVILTLAHYSDIVSDIPSGSIYGIYIYIHIYIFWHCIWHSFWHISHILTFYSFWHSILHLFWHLYRHSFWQLFWHYFWHSIWHFIWHQFWPVFWPPFWHAIWHLFWHLFRHSFWHSLLAFSLFGSWPSTHSVWSSRYEDRRRAGIGVDEKRRRGEEGGLVAPLVKSRDPHLAGGKNNMICRSYYKCFFNRTNH